MIKYLITIILATSFTISFAQSPWVKEKGSGYAHLKGGFLPAYNTVFPDENNDNSSLYGNISEQSIDTYIEYGLGHKLQANLSLPYRFLSSEITASDSTNRVGSSVSGLGNAELGLKYSILDKGILLAGLLNVKTPGTGHQLSSGLRTGYDAWSVSPMVSLGKGINKFYFYVYTGAELYGKSYSDNFLIGGEAGITLKEKFTASLTLSARQSLKNKTRTDAIPFQETYLYVNNQSYAGGTLKLHYQFTELIGVNASAYVANFYAENLPKSGPISLGVHFKW